jgi:transcriptional regulator with XRE-family HTH domain
VTSHLRRPPSLNETFCRALLQAGLTEEDIAARLGVDPKSVRRWIEGRALPYRRHRWALAALLSTAETDLWPQLRSNRPRPEEVVTVYPHLAAVPRGAWLQLFGSAQHEIGLLDHQERPLVRDHDVAGALAERAEAGIDVRICLGGLDGIEAGERSALARYAPLRDHGQVSIRLHRGVLYNPIYRADDQLFVVQRAYGVGIGEAPVLHLERAGSGEMFDIYVASFERAWAEAEPRRLKLHRARGEPGPRRNDESSPPERREC